jgi:hypothetical protein
MRAVDPRPLRQPQAARADLVVTMLLGLAVAQAARSGLWPR